MTIIDFYKRKIDYYIPKTPSAAINAYEIGILPIEYYIYKATSTISLDEDVVDINEIERIISIPDLDIYVNCLLITILERLINNSDPELALFAAESINLIESRYNMKIEKINKELLDKNEPEKEVQIAHLYYELALLNYKKESIKLFYLEEAYYKMKNVIFFDKILLKDIRILVKILIELKQYENAISLLYQVNKENDISLLILVAEVEFERKNYIEVYKIVSHIFSYKKELNAQIGTICSYWLDSSWIERSEYV